MKTTIESEVRFFSPETADEFLIILNAILYCKNEEQLKSWVFGAKDRFKNWFFYFGSSHLAVHQKTTGKTFDRVLFVKF